MNFLKNILLSHLFAFFGGNKLMTKMLNQKSSLGCFPETINQFAIATEEKERRSYDMA